jgi:hypothetical protein
MSSPTMVDDEEKKMYWSCPVNFIPQSVWYFLENKLYYSKHPSAPFPNREKVSPRYLKAENIFDSEFAQCMKEIS